jgi:RNA polymerase sigma-70 factor (ECF subfamily)
MHEEPTTVIIQRYLDALPGDVAAEPVVQGLLERAAGRLRLLCGTHLNKSYPRLTRPPANLETVELPYPAGTEEGYMDLLGRWLRR